MLSERSDRPREESLAQATIDLRASARIDRARVASVASRRGIEPESLFLASSPEAALLTVFHVLGDPGDEVLAPAPLDPRHAELATASGLHVASFPLVAAETWSVDARALFDAPTERTRAVVLGRPARPSGIVLDGEVLEVLGELGLPVVCDESELDPSLGSIAQGMPRDTEHAPLVLLVGREDEHVLVAVRGPEDRAGPVARRLASFEATLLGSPRAPIDTARARRNAGALPALFADAPCLVPAVAAGAMACVGIRSEASSAAWRSRLASEGVLVDAVDGAIDLEHAWISFSLDADEAAFAAAMRGIAALARRERTSPIEPRGPRRVGPR